MAAAEKVPVPANPRAVAETEMVSIEATPVNAPPVVTFRPVEVRAKESKAEPTTMASAVVLLVPILMLSPPVPVPMLMVLAVLPVPTLTAPLVPESTVTAPVVPEVNDRSVPAAEVMPPRPANPRAVAEVEMVSIEATPVKAPPVVTFKPPFEVRAKVPVALPTAVFPVPEVLMLTVAASVAPAVAVRRPFNVSLSSIGCRIQSSGGGIPGPVTDSSRWKSPVMFPVQLKLPGGIVDGTTSVSPASDVTSMAPSP